MQQSWFDLATDAREAANRLVSENYRSCLSRAYYAVYSKVTFDLSAIPGVAFPDGDEGPKHPGRAGSGGIRRLVEGNMSTFNVPKRVKLS